MNTPRHHEPAPPPPPVDATETRAADSLEEYLVEYLCRERFGADEIKELLIAEALSRCDY